MELQKIKIRNEQGKLSKTLIFNSVMISVDFAAANIAMLQPHMEPQVYVYTFLALGVVQKVGNMWLRVITKGALQ